MPWSENLFDGAYSTAYASAYYIIIATPTNYDPKRDPFDCSAMGTVYRSYIICQ